MQEQVLANFFAGSVSASDLERDLSVSVVQHDAVRSSVKIEDMNEDFGVTRFMLVKLCDAVIAGQIDPEHLSIVGFVLIASDKFHWDSDSDGLMADIINDWSCPEVNYPLTVDNVRRFRRWLLREEPYPVKPHSAASEGAIISSRQKRATGKWKKRFQYFLEHLF